jgi:hypothetical protein
MNKLVFKMVRPFIKSFLKKEITNEAYQCMITDKILEKVDLPKLTKAQEKKFLDSVYDASQELLLEYIESI